MNYFSDIEVFSEISESDQISLSDFCQLQDFAPGEIVFHEGDEPQALYIIKDGDFVVTKQSNPKKVVLHPGDILGEMAFYGNDTKRNATVTSMSDGQLIIILHFSLEQMMKKYPELAEKIKQIITERS